MLDLFSDNSIKTIVFAQEEARNKNLNELSPIDMFIGILRNKECDAYKIISSQIDLQERFFEKNKSLKENSLLKRNIEIGLNKEAKEIIGDAIYERNIASSKFHFKTKFVNSIKLLKSILNSKEKNLLLFFDDNKINYEELLNKVNKKVIEDWMGSDINQEEFFRYLNVESLNEEGEWIFEGTYTNHLAFKIAYSEYHLSIIPYRIVDFNNNVIEIIDSKSISDKTTDSLFNETYKYFTIERLNTLNEWIFVGTYTNRKVFRMAYAQCFFIKTPYRIIDCNKNVIKVFDLTKQKEHEKIYYDEHIIKPFFEKGLI